MSPAPGLLLAFLLLAQEPKHFDPAVHEAKKQFAYEDFFVVPVRVHLLRSTGDDAVNCRLQAADVRRVFGKANRIWNKAGVALRVESVVEETAEAPEGFNGLTAAAAEFKSTRPEKSRDPDMLHVYYVHRLPTNGVYMGRDAIFVKDTAKLNEAPGGVDEPIPRVTSHEIGHAMTLSHRQDRINLMASGTTGWSLNDFEADQARAWAKRQKWVLTPAQALDKGHHEILAEIPGESEIKRRAAAALGK